jgi:hypothetical protein
MREGRSTYSISGCGASYSTVKPFSWTAIGVAMVVRGEAESSQRCDLAAACYANECSL